MNCKECPCKQMKEIVHGRCAVMGCTEGIAKVVKDPGNLENINENNILITYMTTPDSVPAMMRSKAVVTDRGGVLCHAAIICREINKPCIVAAKDCMDIIKDGDKLLVCATNGKVYKK